MPGQDLSDEAVQISIRASKLTLNVLLKALRTSVLLPKKHLEKQQQKEHKVVRGQQSIKELNRQNQNLQSVPITDTDLKAFKKELKKLGIDFSILKNPDASQDGLKQFDVWFKGQDSARIQSALEKVVQQFENKEIVAAENNSLDEDKDNLFNDKADKKPMKEQIAKATQKAKEYNENRTAKEKTATKQQEQEI